jgi:hypothetical protein
MSPWTCSKVGTNCLSSEILWRTEAAIAPAMLVDSIGKGHGSVL